MPPKLDVPALDVDALKIVIQQWSFWNPPRRKFSVTAVIKPDEGGFVAYALLLPNALSGGSTLEEAKRNIREATAGVIDEYLATEGTVPWLPSPLPEDEPVEGDVLFAFTVDA